MAKNKKQPQPDEELELDKAYWELTGYKFNRKKRSPLLWFFILGIALAIAWYFDFPELLAAYFS